VPSFFTQSLHNLLNVLVQIANKMGLKIIKKNRTVELGNDHLIPWGTENGVGGGGGLTEMRCVRRFRPLYQTHSYRLFMKENHCQQNQEVKDLWWQSRAEWQIVLWLPSFYECFITAWRNLTLTKSERSALWLAKSPNRQRWGKGKEVREGWGWLTRSYSLAKLREREREFPETQLQ
jgi:hypothetical protein